MRFDDNSYIEAFIKRGEYPKIHDDIFHISRHLQDECVLDLGSCTGLLSKRLSTRNESVIGIEANPSSYAKSIPGDNITYYNLKIDDQTLPLVKQIIIKHRIQTVYARRVFPELYNTGGGRIGKKDLRSICRVRHTPYRDRGAHQDLESDQSPVKRGRGVCCIVHALSAYKNL